MLRLNRKREFFSRRVNHNLSIKEVVMKTIIRLSLLILLALGSLTAGHETAFAEGGVIGSRESEGVFAAVKRLLMVTDQEIGDAKIDQLVNISELRLSSDTTISTYLVEGFRGPFVGARRAMWWIVLHKRYGGYWVIGDFGSADDVRITSHRGSGGFLDVIVTYPATNFDPTYDVRFSFDGKKYQQR